MTPRAGFAWICERRSSGSGRGMPGLSVSLKAPGGPARSIASTAGSRAESPGLRSKRSGGGSRPRQGPEGLERF